MLLLSFSNRQRQVMLGVIRTLPLSLQGPDNAALTGNLPPRYNLMKLFIIFLLFFTNIVEAKEHNDLHSWLTGKWVESGGDCPTTIQFIKSKKIIFETSNSQAIGIYKITGKAVLIPKDSICWKSLCYEMEINITESTHREGCGSEWSLGKDEFNNFRKKDKNKLIFNGFIFTRGQQL